MTLMRNAATLVRKSGLIGFFLGVSGGLVLSGCQNTDSQESGLQAVTEAAKVEIGGIQWHSDYYAAYNEAKAQKRDLVIYFYKSDSNAKGAFESVTLADAGVAALLSTRTLAALDVGYQIDVNGQKQTLMDHGAFKNMRGEHGIAILRAQSNGSLAATGLFPFFHVGGENAPSQYKNFKAFSVWTIEPFKLVLGLKANSWEASMIELAKSPAAVGTYYEMVPNPNYLGLTVSEHAVIKQTNQRRLQGGRQILIVKAELMDGCRAHARRMAGGLGMQHASGNFAENIAWNQQNPSEVMQAWMNSSGHRANIMNGSYRYMGAADFNSGGGPYWCQRFVW